MKPRSHHPPHTLLDNTWHLITAATVEHKRLLAREGAKETVRDAVRELIEQMGVHLLAWVVLENHYHLILKAESGEDLARFCRLLNGRTSRQINRLDGMRGRQVWHNYWDSCISSEAALWARFNYVHQNPVKHGYVNRPENWLFSSYDFYRRAKGDEWLADCWMRYPVVDYGQEDRF